MGCYVWICMFLLFHRASSYVLLTANVDDIHAIVSQVATSPVVTQLKDIWNKASDSFKKHYLEPEERARDDDDSAEWHNERRGVSVEGEYHKDRVLKSERRKAVNQIMELGRNASLYLRSMKDMFDRL